MTKGESLRLAFWKAVCVAMMSMPLMSMADDYTNGWTEHSFKVAVTGSVAAAYDKQMRFMYSSGQIAANATGAEIDAASAMVTTFVTSTCTCAQRRFVQDIRFEDIQSIYQRRDYAAQIMDTCAKEVLKKRA